MCPSTLSGYHEVALYSNCFMIDAVHGADVTSGTYRASSWISQQLSITSDGLISSGGAGQLQHRSDLKWRVVGVLTACGREACRKVGRLHPPFVGHCDKLHGPHRNSGLGARISTDLSRQRLPNLHMLSMDMINISIDV